MEEEVNKIDADLYNKLLEDRMIFGFTFEELMELRCEMNKYCIKKISAKDCEGESVISLINFAYGEGII